MAGWTPFAEKYSIHQETYDYFCKNITLGNRPYYELGVEKAREQSIRSGLIMAGDIDFPGQSTSMMIPSPHTSEGIPATVYTMTENCAYTPAIMVYFVSGGLVLGSPKVAEPALKAICRDSGCIVVSVACRLLPNKESPCAPLDDGVIATRWVMDNKLVLGGRPGSKVGVGGDSSGGFIACSVTNEVRGLDFQVLVYPIGDLSRSQSSFEEFRNIPGLNEHVLGWYFEHGVKDMPNFLTDPRINPMARTNTELSPPALILVAELDPLVGPGMDYAEKLRTAGVPVCCEVIQGVPHAFFYHRAVFKTKSKEASDHIVRFIKQYQGI